jgi:hypothetical protein
MRRGEACVSSSLYLLCVYVCVHYPRAACRAAAYLAYVSIRQRMSAYVSIRQRMSAYVSIRQRMSAYVSIRQRMSAYVSIRERAPLNPEEYADSLCMRTLRLYCCFTAAPEEHTLSQRSTQILCVYAYANSVCVCVRSSGVMSSLCVCLHTLCVCLRTPMG